MKIRTLSILADALFLASAASARVCMVYDFDTRGCRAGDDLLYMPRSFGNEQLPIEFVGKKCNMSKPIALTKGGVACTYAGPKNVVEGAEEFQRTVYRSTFESAQGEARANKGGWVAIENGEYWRVLPQEQSSLKGGTGEKIKLGDRVELYYAACRHEADDVHNRPDSYEPEGAIDSIEETHYLWMAGSLFDGAVVEVVGPARHGFVGVKKGQPKPSKKK